MPMSARLLRPRASGRINPKSLSGLVGWWDASDNASITLTSGFVSQLDDKSGSGYHLSQSAEAARPSLSTVNGKQFLLFDGSNDWLTRSVGVNPTGTVLAVAATYYLTPQTAVQQNVMSFGQVTTANFQHALGVFNNGWQGDYRNASTFANYGRAAGSASTSSLAILSGVYAGNAGSNFRLNKSLYASAATTVIVSNTNSMSIGGRNVNGSLVGPFNGIIGEVIWYNRTLSDAEILSVENYLAAKWGTTAVSDADANAYIQSVEAADGLALENGVRQAINNFVVGCKADGTWSAIKASCILMGARTLAGALKPLAGPSPTNYNFVSGDYNRKTGLAGNSVNKYLDTGHSNTANGQNDAHMGVYATSFAAETANFLGSGTNANSGSSAVGYSTTATLGRSRNTANDVLKSSVDVGFVGHSRAASAEFTARSGGVTSTVSRTSQAAHNANVFAYLASGGATYSGGRMAFYSIGSSLDLQLLDSRVSQLYTDITAAIP